MYINQNYESLIKGLVKKYRDSEKERDKAMPKNPSSDGPFSDDFISEYSYDKEPSDWTKEYYPDQYKLLSVATGLDYNTAEKMTNMYRSSRCKIVYFNVSEYKNRKLTGLTEMQGKAVIKEFKQEILKCPLFIGSDVEISIHHVCPFQVEILKLTKLD